MVSLVHDDYKMATLPKHLRPSFIIEDVLKGFRSSQNYFSGDEEHIPLPGVTIPHQGRVNEAFNSMRYVLLLLGRFPFIPSLKFLHQDQGGGHSFHKGKDYSSSIKSLAWVYFGITSLLLVILLAVSMGSFVGVFLSWSFFNLSEWSDNQKKLFRENLIPFVLVWGCLLSVTVGNISFLVNRKTVAKFLNYWNVAVDSMDVEMPRRIGRFLHMNNLWFLAFGMILVVATNFLEIKLAEGGSNLMGLLLLRLMFPHIDNVEEMWFCRILGMVIILYAMYASRAMLFIFVFKCKLLRHCIKVHNTRLRKELMKSRHGSFEIPNEEMRCQKLFLDHAILLKLVRLTDKVFAAILLSYFGSQILNMCFELFYVAMSNSTTIFNTDGNGWDTFSAILLLMQNVYVFLSVSLHAASVAEEADKGFEIVKSKGISVHDSVARRHLLFSLQISYQHKICISGGHYFTVDKPFIVTVLGAVFTYFIIIVQYGYQYSCSPHSNNSSIPRGI